MQFNAGDSSIVSDVRWWCRLDASDTTLYPLADIARNANMGLDRVTALIQEHDNTFEWDDFNNTDLPIATADLVSGQQDYPLELSHLKILRVRAKDQQGNWVTLDPVSRHQLTDDQLAATGTPWGYDKFANSIFLVGTPNYGSTGGLELQFQRGASFFDNSDTSKKPGFAAQFHRLISLYAALDYCDIHLPDQAKKIRARIGNPPDTDLGIKGSGLEGDLAAFYSDRDRDQIPKITLERTLETF